MIMVILCFLIGCANGGDEFTSAVREQDFEFVYDDSGSRTIETVIVPKYDFIEFSYKLVFYGKGLLNDYEKEIEVGNVKAGTELKHSELISDIEDNIKGSLAYCDIIVISGKKQQKYNYNKTELNDELTFDTITMKRNTISFRIINNTDYYIKEIRKLNISMNFGNDITCKFYTPRIQLEASLGPGAQTTLTNLSGNIHLGLGANDIEEKNELVQAGIEAVSYSNQTYQLIYTI